MYECEKTQHTSTHTQAHAHGSTYTRTSAHTNTNARMHACTHAPVPPATASVTALL
jgi:hypothetical protein